MRRQGIFWAAVMCVTGVSWVAFGLTSVFLTPECAEEGCGLSVLAGLLFLVALVGMLVGVVGLYAQRAVLPRASVWLLVGGCIGFITFLVLEIAGVVTAGPLFYLSNLFALLLGLTWLAIGYVLWSSRVEAAASRGDAAQHSGA